jgi:N-acyl-D-glutamate deacylase
MNKNNLTAKPNEPGPYDLVIANGRVIDPETGLDATRHVGVKRDRIAAISETPLQGTKTVDATGLVVAPGFVDLHAHGQELPAARMRAFDGVTTALELESGLLPISDFYADVAKEGRPINYGASAAWTYGRITVMEQGAQPPLPPPNGTIEWFGRAFAYSGWQNTLATDEQLTQILDWVETGLKEGGIGIGINGGYAPGYGRKEYYALAQLAARYQVPTFTHVRYVSVIEPNSAFEAIEELISLAADTGTHMHLCHLGSTSGCDVTDCADLLRKAQERGVHVTTESYPYGAASTAIGAQTFRNPNWMAQRGVKGYSAVEYNGQSMTEASFNALQQSDPGAVVVLHFLEPETDPGDQALLDKSVLYEGAAIASDAMCWTDSQGNLIQGNVWPLPADAFAHPRSAGTYARFVRQYVREGQKLSLLEALRKTSLIPAQVLEKSVPQMRNKGRLQVGADADIVVFDLNTITDRATYVEPAQTSVGVHHLIVNGDFSIQDGELLLDSLPGRPVRRPVQT